MSANFRYFMFTFMVFIFVLGLATIAIGAVIQ